MDAQAKVEAAPDDAVLLQVVAMLLVSNGQHEEALESYLRLQMPLQVFELISTYHLYKAVRDRVGQVCVCVCACVRACVRAVTLTQDDTHLAIDLAAHLSTHKQLKRLQQCLGHHFVFKEMLNEPGHVVNSLGHVNRDIRQILEQQLEPCFAVVLGDNPTHT